VQFREIRNINAVCDQIKVSRRDLIVGLYKEIGEDIVQSLSISKDINQVSRESGIPCSYNQNLVQTNIRGRVRFVGTSIVPNEEIICPYCKTQASNYGRGLQKRDYRGISAAYATIRIPRPHANLNIATKLNEAQ